jgi:hypothetical protein
MSLEGLVGPEKDTVWLSRGGVGPCKSCCSLASLPLLLLYSFTGLHFVDRRWRPDTDFMKIYMGTIAHDGFIEKR